MNPDTQLVRCRTQAGHGFNEAEAQAPRIRSGSALGRVFCSRFNEAEAQVPRIPLRRSGPIPHYLELQ